MTTDPWAALGGVLQAVPIEEGVDIEVPVSLLDGMIAFEEVWITLLELLRERSRLEAFPEISHDHRPSAG